MDVISQTGLVFDTSTERGVAAAYDGEKCLFQELLPFGIQNSDLLLPALQKRIQEHSLTFDHLSFIAAGIGPGSYTGIRVGATIGKILSFALRIPLVGICTLEAFVPEREGVFAAMIDAKIGGVYLLIGHHKKGEVEFIMDPGAFSIVEAVEKLKGIPLIVTPNAEKIRPKLETASPGSAWEWLECYPQPERLYQTARKKMQAGNMSCDQQLDLLYLRKTQAELEKERKPGRPEIDHGFGELSCL